MPQLSLVRPHTNTIAFRADHSGPALLELSSEHVQLNTPDGSPLIEARADGKVLIRGEEMSDSNQELYDDFTQWVKKCCQSMLRPQEPVPEPVSRAEYGESLLAKVLPIVRTHELLEKASLAQARRHAGREEWESSVLDRERGDADRGHEGTRV